MKPDHAAASPVYRSLCALITVALILSPWGAARSPVSAVGDPRAATSTETPRRFDPVPLFGQDHAPLSAPPAASAAPAVPSSAPSRTVAETNAPLFIENVGQFDSRARFQVRGASGGLFLSDDALWYTFLEHPTESVTHTTRTDSHPPLEQPRHGVNLKLSFVGANPHPRVEPFNRLDTHVSYFIGSDSSHWHTDVPVWSGVRYVDLYPGIDLELTGQNGQLRQRFVVRDATRLAQVHLRIEGAEGAALNDGAGQRTMHLTTSIGEMTLPLFDVAGLTTNASVPAPTVTTNEIAAPFNVPASGHRPPGLPSLPMNKLDMLPVVPPAPSLQPPLFQRDYSTLSVTNTQTSVSLYSTYLGGNNNGVGWGHDSGHGIAVDASGAAYVTGYTESADFPTQTGSFTTTFQGGSDAFVTKLTPDGSALIYSTFLGGDGYDVGMDIALDASGEAYVTGYTGSFNFPHTAGSYSGNSDAFVTKLNATGDGLIYSTFLGGTDRDLGQSIALNATEEAYVTGWTQSSNFPTTTTALQTSCTSCSAYSDVFVTKLSADGSTRLYSTFLGGSHEDYGFGIAVDGAGKAYVTGMNGASDFPFTTCISCPVSGGVFVTKIDPSQAGAASRIYSTYLGNGSAYGVTVDASGAAYVTGVAGPNFPITAGTYNGGTYDAFVTKLNTNGSALVYSVYLGGSRMDNGDNIAVDSDGAAYVVGWTESSNFPTTSWAFQTTCGGGSCFYPPDVFVTKLSATGIERLYSTYLGGSGYEGDDGPGDIAVDANGSVYVTDDTSSSDFPTTPGAFQTKCSGNCPGNDAFVTKLGASLLDGLVRNQACPLCTAYDARHHAGGPIDTLSGNYTHQKVDESIPVLGRALAFERSYSADARSLFTRTLGYGWTHNHDIRLVFPNSPGGQPGQVLLQAPGGAQLPFFDRGNGVFKPYAGVTAQLAQLTATGGITTYVVTAANQTLYTFNASGLVTQTVSPAGTVITYTYYPTGSLKAVQSGGRALSFFYDTSNRLTRVTDPINRSTQFGYNTNSDLTVITDTRNLTWTYQYSGTTHLLTKIIDPDNRTIERTEFDAQGRAIKQYNGKDELVVQLDYTSGTVITVTDGLSHRSVDRYRSGTWLGGSDAASQAVTRTYDINFKPTLAADPNGHATSLLWNANGNNLERIVDANGSLTTLRYDALNNLTQTIDTRGFTTTYRYSGTLLISQTNALRQTTIYTYGPNSLLLAQQDPLGRVTRYGYNSFGERTAITDALTNTTRFVYDPVGRLITTTDAIGRITVNAYDNADHLIAVTSNYTTASTQQNYLDTWNLITRYGYDGFGRQIALTDTLNHVTRNYYDPAGRLISVTVNFTTTGGVDPTVYNLKTWYGYDAVGNQIAVTDTLQHVTFTEYDNLNRPVTVTQNYKDGVFDPNKPDEDVKQITHYDPAGNVLEQIDPLGHVTRNGYDSLNRVISTTTNYTITPGADPNTYNLTTQNEYDPGGNQIAMTDTLTHVTRNYYDPLGRLISTTVNYLPGFGPNYLNQYNLTTWYEYDPVGNRVTVTDALSTPTRYTYDKLNRVIATTNVSGTTYTQYDALGNRVAVTDALTHTTVYTYNAVGQLSKLQDAGGNVTAYGYDALGRTIVVTDPLTHTTRTFYDAAGRVVSTTNALTGTTVITYDVLGRKVGYLNENGKPSYIEYDGLGRTIAMTDATGSATRSVYDALGNRTQVIDGLRHPLTSTYDAANRLVMTQDALGNPTHYGYDGLGNRVVMTDANDVVTRYGYDALSRLSAVTESVTSTLGLDPAKYNVVTRYGYDALSNRVAMTDALTHTTVYTYDRLSRLIALSDPLTHITRYQYDAVGNRVKTIDANNQTITYTYDALNRNTKIAYGTSTTTFEYDPVGNRKTMTDSLGVTRYVYDELNRLKQVTDPFTGIVQYRYDAVGNRTNLIYPDGKVVTYTFDAASRLTGTLSWDGQLTTYAFDKAGRLITTTLPNGLTEVNTYDAANRITRLTHKLNGLTLGDYQYTSDKVGNRTQAIEMVSTYTTGVATGTSVFIVSASTDDAFVSSYNQTIDLNFASTTMGYVQYATYNNYKTAGYRFNPVTLPAGASVTSAQLRLMASATLNSIISLYVGGESAAAPATYSTYADFVGRSLTTDYAGGPMGTWTQDQDYAFDVTSVVNEIMTNWISGNPMAFQVKGAIGMPGGNNAVGPLASGTPHTREAYSKDGSSGSALPARLALTYTYPVSNYLPVTTTINYTYDPLYRLTNANYSGAYTYTFGYGYDRVGNRTAQTETITSTQVTNYVYDAANRLTSVNGQAYTWDDNGNLINDGSAAYLYDRANRMISTTVGGVTTQFAYNGDGVRLRQIIAGVPTTYTQDLAAPLPVVLQSKTGANATQYLYALGTRPLAQNGGAWEYLLPDALGSVRQIADASGNVTLAESYEPYGSVLTSTGTASSIFGFSGEQIDTTGLIYLRARYMNPRLGIFMTEDTVPGNASLPHSLHIYVYAWNNPVNLLDPSGKQVPPPECKPGEICSTGPTGPYVLQTPPTSVEYVPNPPSPELLRLPTGYVSGYSSTADLAPWGIHTTDIKIGNQCFRGNGIVAGEEWVWDYRHLQKALFRYSGITQDFGALFGGWPAQFYTGLVTGFRKGIDDYAGYFRTSEIAVSKSIIGIGGMWAVGLNPITGEEDPNATRASYSLISLGLSVGLPIGIGTSYTNYERVSPIGGIPNRVDQPGTALSFARHDRAILAEAFAQDIENAGPLDQNARIAAALARIWGQYDDQ